MILCTAFVQPSQALRQHLTIPGCGEHRIAQCGNYLSGMRAWSQSPMREAEGLSRLHNTITDWPDSGHTRRIAFIPGAPPPWPQPAFPPIEAEIVKKPRVCPVRASHAGKFYRRRFVSVRLAATLLADGASCFVICACPALVIKRD